MTWQILDVEPAHAVCDQCKRHDCGIVDGQHKWVRTGIVDQYGDHIIIGHGCVNAWAENMGIAREVVTKEVVRPPTYEEIGKAVADALIKLNNSEGVISNADRLVLGDHSNPPADPGVETGQQTDTGTPKPQGNRSRANNTNRASVRQQRNVRAGEAKQQPGKHTEGTKDSD